MQVGLALEERGEVMADTTEEGADGGAVDQRGGGDGTSVLFSYTCWIS